MCEFEIKSGSGTNALYAGKCSCTAFRFELDADKKSCRRMSPCDTEPCNQHRCVEMLSDDPNVPDDYSCECVAAGCGKDLCFRGGDGGKGCFQLTYGTETSA